MLTGEPLTPGHTYALILHDITQIPGDAPIGADDDFKAMLAASPPVDPVLSSAYAAYRPLRDYLAETKTLSATTVINAAVFTVGHPARGAENLARVVNALPAPVATGWIKCGRGTPSPCPDATGDRACDAAQDPAFDELQALVQLPIFQSGTPPYAKPEAGGHIDLDAPARRANRERLPLADHPQGRDHARERLAPGHLCARHRAAASAATFTRDRQGARHSRVSTRCPLPFSASTRCSTVRGAADRPIRRTTSFTTSPTLTPRATTRCRARSIRCRSPSSPPRSISPTPRSGSDLKSIRPHRFSGAIRKARPREASARRPHVSDSEAMVFSGQGASLIDALLNKTNPVNIAAAVALALSDLDPAQPTRLRDGIFHPVLSLSTDVPRSRRSAEPRRPMAPAKAGGHHVFQVYGLDDTYAPVGHATHLRARGEPRLPT